jgi:hypothetical protein
MMKFFQNAKIHWKEYWLHEKNALHLGADSLCTETGGIRDTCCRSLLEDGHRRIDVLSLEEEVYRDGRH